MTVERMTGHDTGGAGSNEILTAALGLLTATHADSRMAGPVTMDYLAGVPTDRSQMLDLVAGMTALASLLIEMRTEETGVAPEETLAELGRRFAIRFLALGRHGARRLAKFYLDLHPSFISSTKQLLHIA